MSVASSRLPKDIRLVSALGWYRLFVEGGLTRRVSRWLRAEPKAEQVGEG